MKEEHDVVGGQPVPRQHFDREEIDSESIWGDARGLKDLLRESAQARGAEHQNLHALRMLEREIHCHHAPQVKALQGTAL